VSAPALDVAALVPALLVGFAAATMATLVWRPLPRLAPRLRPYNTANRVRLGQPADLVTPAATPAGTIAAVFGPILRAVSRALGRLVDREPDNELALRLRNAGLDAGLAEEQRVAAYRTRQLGWTAASVGLAGLPALMLGSATWLVVLVPLGAVFGLTYPRAQLDAAIRQRRDRMTIDLYTVNQHLAQMLVTGRGVDEALQRLTRRGRGPVVTELAEALRWRRAGMPLDQALEALAERTPEAHAARTYRTLAKAATSGASVADGLRALADDVRNSRRDALQRLAVRRRATMIIPIVLLLVPPLIILVGAPLPGELFGHLR
jgi:tight adherence protein C